MDSQDRGFVPLAPASLEALRSAIARPFLEAAWPSLADPKIG